MSFAFCRLLTEFLFERRSKMNRIDSSLFYGCRSLRAFCIPSLFKVVESDLFDSPRSLTELTFQSPSHLRRLALPASDFGSLCIPDSVKVIRGYLRESGYRSCALQFGEKSRLKEIELYRYEGQYGPANDRYEGIGVFLHFSERQLRKFRSKCKFSSGVIEIEQNAIAMHSIIVRTMVVTSFC
jgi:hypothetical protein